MAKLTAAKIKQLKPREKAYKVYDSDGLYVEVPATGRLRWRFRYQFAGKAKLISMGVYPDVSLAEARRTRDEARKLLREGKDPSARRRKAKLEEAISGERSFRALCQLWVSNAQHLKPTSLQRDERILDNDLLPDLGPYPAADIEPTDLLIVLRKVEKRAPHVAHRARSLAGRIFRFGVANGWCKRDVTVDLRGALKKPATKNRAAVTTSDELSKILKLIDGYRGTFVVERALRLAPMLLVRPGELRHAEWSELKLQEAMWRIPAGKMKSGRDHLVPLPNQAVSVFRELEGVTGHRQWVFTNARSPRRPMSEVAITAALRAMGISGETMSWHGFRATGSTLLHEMGWKPDVIEAAQARAVPGVRGVYNRALYLDERRNMLQQWADYLDQLRSCHNNERVTPIRVGR